MSDRFVGLFALRVLSVLFALCVLAGPASRADAADPLRDLVVQRAGQSTGSTTATPRPARGCPARIPPEGVICYAGRRRCQYGLRSCMCAADGHRTRRWACFATVPDVVNE